mmetsp:Transcript_10240/g.18918  ORF Transcript_10240/g.18918 Transcript_10240/m.18918 type:complete len:89 (+) Transcript_10240:512-778(+)
MREEGRVLDFQSICLVTLLSVGREEAMRLANAEEGRVCENGKERGYGNGEGGSEEEGSASLKKIAVGHNSLIHHQLHWKVDKANRFER